MQRRMSSAPTIWAISIGLAVIAPASLASGRALRADEPKWQSLFDGKSLKGWSGDPEFWRVEDGAITGETTPNHMVRRNTFLINEEAKPGNFELKAEFKLIGGNSGIQYRSFDIPGRKWGVSGYQADMDGANTYTGIIYGENFRSILAGRGQKTVIGPNHKPRVVEQFASSAELARHIKNGQWNTYEILARGFHFEQRINGVLMSALDDEDTQMRRASGILALQLHQGFVMKVQFRNIMLREYPAEHASTGSGGGARAAKKIVFIAGTPSHGYAQHEHRAGCLLLAKALSESVPGVHTVVVTNGWPQDPKVLDDADCIVVYSDGGTGHPLYSHLDEFDALMKRGIGLVCIHYAVEVPKGKAGDRMAEWTGGYFEPNWSVNPTWTAHYKTLLDHVVTRGVRPFSIHDEWYYHMRFLPSSDVTPILVDVPPQETLNRPDGTHSGNPFVRAEIKEKRPQAMAWLRQRPDGGRGFGISGGHYHFNWGNDDFRKLVLNAIVWAAHGEVPPNGVSSRPLTAEDLEANLDTTRDKRRRPQELDRTHLLMMLSKWRAEPGS